MVTWMMPVCWLLRAALLLALMRGRRPVACAWCAIRYVICICIYIYMRRVRYPMMFV